MTYTNPAGVSNQVSSNAFVVYINGTLYGSNAASTGALPTTVQSLSVSAGVTNTNTVGTIGKMGWWGGSSSQPYNVTFDNVYAGDSMPIVGNPPTITSANSAVPLLNIPYTYQIVTDPIGATSFALKNGTFPPGLSLNLTNGLISGTPSVLGGPTTVILAASNSIGEGPTFNLSFTVNLPFNTFSGSNPSLNDGSWSLGAPPNSSVSIGSYLDVLLTPSVSDLTTASGSLFVKSWNVTNGSSYTLTSLKPDGSTTYHMGRLPAAATFTNLVSGLANDLVYLTNNSTLTFSPSNTSLTPTNSTVNLAYGGNLNISAGSTLNIDAVLTGNSATFGINKTGSGTLNLSGANTFGGSAAGTTLTAGTLNVKGSAAPTRLAQVQAVLSNNVVTGFRIVDGGAGYTVAPTISMSKSTGDTTGSNAVATATISNGVITAITTTNGGTNYTLPPKVYAYSAQSPLGFGPSTFNGGTLTASVDTDISRMSAYADGTNTFFRINGSDTAFNGPTTLDINSGKTLSCYTLAGNTNPANLITKNGTGTLWLRGGGSTGFIGGFRVNAGTLYINGSVNSGSGTNGTITMNGGNLLLAKGIGSGGTYSALDISNTISVLADTTITLDPNPASATENNSCSTPLLQSSNRTITVAKTATANAGAQMLFKSAELGGMTTFNVADATQVALCGAVGTGGVTKTGLGTLVLSALSSTNSTNNTYTGTTRINQGTVEFAPASSQDSSITVASNAVAKFTLGATTPTTSGSLTLSDGSKVRISGTPSLGSYTLFTASNGISGNPQLEAAITGGTLNITNNSLILNVQKVIPTITVTTGTSYIYSGFPIDSASITVNKGGSQGLLTLTYVGVSTTYGPSSTPPTNAGIYTVTAEVEGDTTYQAANSLPATFTINPAAISAGSITVAPPIAGLTYDGNPKVHEATATGLTSFTYSYVGRNGTVYGSLPTAPTAAGFYTVTATSSNSNYTGSKSVDFTITKATPTISVAPTASPITVGQALSDSRLSSGSATGVGGANVEGAFAWTSGSPTPSETSSYEVTFTPTSNNYHLATTSVSVTVNPATPTGPTFTNTFGSVSPTNVGTDGLAYLMKYALGGTNTNDKVSLPTVSVSGSALTLTAVVRTNDTNVQIVGQWVTGLGGTWSNVPTNPYGTASINTSNVPTGCERRDFSVLKDSNSRLFLRLKATQTP
jgi:autotransporter-associated beta strand protein